MFATAQKTLSTYAREYTFGALGMPAFAKIADSEIGFTVKPMLQCQDLDHIAGEYWCAGNNYHGTDKNW